MQKVPRFYDRVLSKALRCPIWLSWPPLVSRSGVVSLQSSLSEGVLICSAKGSHVKTEFMRVEEKYGCPPLQRTGPRKERPPQAGRRWKAQQAASLLGGREQPRIFQGESQGWKEFSDTSSDPLGRQGHGARHNTDKVTQRSTGLNTQPWEPGHKSATPGEIISRRGRGGPGAVYVWGAALHVGTGLQHWPVCHFESIVKRQAQRHCSFASRSLENSASRNTEARTLVDSIGNAPS